MATPTAKIQTHLYRQVNEPLRQARIELAAAFRMAARFGWQEQIGGHFSLRVPGDEEQFLINPVGLLWSEITASGLVMTDKDGNKLAGEGEVELTAFCVHSHIHRANERAKCVIHTHTPYATGLASVVDGRLEFMQQGSMRFYGRAAYDDEHIGVVNADEKGRHLAAVLGDKKVMFLASHGTIVTGPTVGDAFLHTYQLERTCMYQAIARMHGQPLRRIDAETAMASQAFYDNEDLLDGDCYFAALKRVLDREEPDYAD